MVGSAVFATCSCSQLEGMQRRLQSGGRRPRGWRVLGPCFLCRLGWGIGCHRGVGVLVVPGSRMGGVRGAAPEDEVASLVQGISNSKSLPFHGGISGLCCVCEA